MREIKFRLFDTKKNEIVNYLNCSIDINGEGVQSFDKDGVIEGTEHNNYLIPLQYTGLKDKNGTEVFEGDILRSGKNLFAVEWSEGIAGFKCVAIEDINHYPAFNTGTIRSLEVVGNKHMNPELLGPGQVSIFE